MLDLKKWAVEYLKHRDIVSKDILEIKESESEESESELIVKRKRLDQCVLIKNMLNWEEISQKIKDNTLLFVEDTSKNIDELVKNWNAIIVHKALNIVFVNASGTNWILNPYAHSMIADKSSLKKGLLSIAKNSRF